jgi:hypothetical protein
LKFRIVWYRGLLKKGLIIALSEELSKCVLRKMIFDSNIKCSDLGVCNDYFSEINVMCLDVNNGSFADFNSKFICKKIR